MRLFGASFFNSSWFLVIVLIVAMGLLLLTSFSRSKKEQNYRNALNEKIVKGTKVRLYSGIYATVLSVRNTTDGQIVLIETGVDDKKSYQEVHINAIANIDESEDLVIDSEGNEVPMSELNKPSEEKIEPVKEEPAEVVEEKPAEEVKEETTKTQKKTKK